MKAVLALLVTAGMSQKAGLCDLVLSGGVCLFGGETVLVPEAAPVGLVGHWSFDDGSGLDGSGLQHHANLTVAAGPAMGGQGASALFNSDYMEVPDAPDLDVRLFTVTTWVYMYRDADAGDSFRWCPILQKGRDDPSGAVYNRSPALFYDRRDRGLRAFVLTTSADAYPQGEFVDSNARLPYQRWTHIAVVRGERRIRLYINGIIDAMNTTEGFTFTNSDSFFIGGAPGYTENCPVRHLQDELRFYSRELTEEEIEAEASGALGELEPRYVRLGCINCVYADAIAACPSGYHLCTSIELHSGGYQVARANGWVNWNSRVWAHGSPSDSELGLGVCCQDLR